ncbi:substrate-binding domain-containing protein [Ectopseudomonas oleovorans]|uniref:substrate-binding domain-containing protein n=1 Tax=Ectopseudomonas oleovorans TaxID=301 RepID=UPI0019CFEF5A|nr:substrate-binding domain-containing protein [Pseudomonas oleovorans]MBN7119795.1 membrane protein [Pseudomonas oleovorans]MBN7130803.1 membrane protein [Pseudomonas oleovorans]MBN7142422.1 membrane protein [Pseudomonas oleovorans]
MPRALSADRDLWGRTLSLLLIGFICYALPLSVFAALPASEGNQPVLRIQGSNTIGAKLGPELVKGLFEAQGLHDIHSEEGARENEQRLLARRADGRQVIVEVAAHGSGTGFTSLKDGSADLAASSRPIKDGEAATLAPLGDMRSPQSEQVIAIDGLAIIVHPSNPIGTLSVEQIAQLFSGEIGDWAALGGKPGKVRPYARDDNSGTYDTFKELVLAPGGHTLAAGAQRFESSTQLSDAVSSDANGIGFIGLPYIRQAKAVAVAAGNSQPMPPSTTLIATEDYPLARRLFLYNDPQLANPWVRALIDFAHSPRGQAIVDNSGFIAQTVQAVKVAADAQMPAEYQQLAKQAQRLSVNFRFQEGSATLDNKAHRDLQRVLDYLKQHDKLQDKVVLVGFGDPKSDPERAELLSKLRAMAVRRELAKQGVLFREIIGMGSELPVAANDQNNGRIRNRRVEVWVY